MINAGLLSLRNDEGKVHGLEPANMQDAGQLPDTRRFNCTNKEQIGQAMGVGI